MVTYNELKNYEAGSSFRWAAYFSGGPAPIPDAQLNLLNGKYTPCTDVDFIDKSVNEIEIPVTKDFSLKVAGHLTDTDTITITFLDDKNGTIRKTISSWSENSSLSAGRVPLVENFYKIFCIDLYTPDLTPVDKIILYIVPKEGITIKKDYSGEADTFQAVFTVVGRES